MSGSDEPEVLICGLGSLGIECVRVLQRYAVPVRAVALSEPGEPVDIPVVRGDCRQGEVLRRAGVERCRAVLLVTGDAQVNMEAALAIRKLNGAVRIVARTSGHHVNALLSGLLGNFVSYEPSRLAAGSLALAALRAEIIGYFSLEGRVVRIVRHRLTSGDRFIGVRLAEVSTHNHVVLAHDRNSAGVGQGAGVGHDEREPRSSSSHLFHDYDPNTALAEGDLVTVLVLGGTVFGEGPAGLADSARSQRPARAARPFSWGTMSRTAKVTLAAAATVLTAVSISMWLFPLEDSGLTRIDGLFTALVLMTGGTYADMFPAFHHLSNLLRAFSILLSIMGTAAVGLLYAWTTDTIMTLRLRLAPRGPQPPRGDHVIIVGLGKIGQTAATLFQALARPAVAVESAALENHGVRDLCVLSGSGTAASTLEAGGIGAARGFLAATGDDWQNLEMALLARTLNPDCALAIRTYERRFSNNVAGIVPHLQVVCVPVVAAKAFAAAALGQTVLDLFQLAGRTVYVVEHRVASGDGLDGRLLSEIAEGYSVVPVLYEPEGATARPWSVVDRPVVLAAGYRVVLLGPSTSLQRIARAEMRPRTSAIELSHLRPHADSLAAATVLAQQLDYSLKEAQDLFASLPAVLAGRFYRQQARRLRAALEHSGVVVALTESSGAIPS